MRFWRKISRPNFLRLAQIFFGLALFALPLRIRSLVYFGESYAGGFFDEYLAFFVQASEILFLISFVLLGLAFVFAQVEPEIPSPRLLAPFALLLAVEILVVPFAHDPLLALLEFWRTLEFAAAAFFIASGIFGTRSVVRILAAAIFFQSALAVAQFFAQGDLGLHFFGESFFDTTTFNIAKTSAANGETLIRGMGTLAHANILGGLAALTLVALTNYSRKHPLVYFVSAVIFAGLFFSFSRAAALAFFLALGALVIFQFRRRIFSAAIAVGLFALLLIFFGAPFFARFAESAPSSPTRSAQIVTAVTLARENMLGTGRGSFTAALVTKFPQLDFYAVQPVHNFFVLKTAEESIFTAVAWVVIFGTLAFFAFQKQKFEALALVVAAFTLANFDHYFSTNFSGEAFLWLAFGIVVSAISAKPKFEKSAVKSAQ
ncbi:MAG: O-antigen ligase family protein [Patescibacteria group bacterium]